MGHSGVLSRQTFTLAYRADSPTVPKRSSKMSEGFNKQFLKGGVVKRSARNTSDYLRFARAAGLGLAGTASMAILGAVGGKDAHESDAAEASDGSVLKFAL